MRILKLQIISALVVLLSVFLSVPTLAATKTWDGTYAMNVADNCDPWIILDTINVTDNQVTTPYGSFAIDDRDHAHEQIYSGSHRILDAQIYFGTDSKGMFAKMDWAATRRSDGTGGVCQGSAKGYCAGVCGGLFGGLENFFGSGQPGQFILFVLIIVIIIIIAVAAQKARLHKVGLPAPSSATQEPRPGIQQPPIPTQKQVGPKRPVYGKKHPPKNGARVWPELPRKKPSK